MLSTSKVRGGDHGLRESGRTRRPQWPPRRRLGEDQTDVWDGSYATAVHHGNAGHRPLLAALEGVIYAERIAPEGNALARLNFYSEGPTAPNFDLMQASMTDLTSLGLV